MPCLDAGFGSRSRYGAVVGGTSHVVACVLVDGRLHGTGRLHRAIRVAMGGIRTPGKLSRSGGLLVAEFSWRHRANVLRDLAPRCGHCHRTRNGAIRVCAKPDLGAQGQAASDPGQSGTLRRQS